MKVSAVFFYCFCIFLFLAAVEERRIIGSMSGDAILSDHVSLSLSCTHAHTHTHTHTLIPSFAHSLTHSQEESNPLSSGSELASADEEGEDDGLGRREHQLNFSEGEKSLSRPDSTDDF